MEGDAVFVAMEYPLLPGAAAGPEAGAAADEQRTAQEHARRQQLEAARRQGIEQGRQMAGEEASAWRQQCGAELGKAIAAFAAERDAYLAQVEKEVVRLALAIAERILHREAQADPLLLSGAVRQALGQLAESTEVRLRVPADQSDLWTEMLRYLPGLALRPQIVADREVTPGSVLLESSLGAVDLSVRAQLDEIERGFFDRTEELRDAAPAPTAPPRKQA